MNGDIKEKKVKFRYEIAQRIALISAAFFLVLSLLLILNYIQTKSVDPLNSKALNSLMLKLQEDPNNSELKEEIRSLDLLARKAFFTSRWQIKAGSYLLFSFALIFLISLKSLSSTRRDFPDLTNTLDSDSSWYNKLISKQYFVIGSIVVFAIALLAGIFSKTDYSISRSIDSQDISNEEIIFDIDKIRENWTQFRGPGGNGNVYNSEDVTISWDGETGENIIWKTPVPLEGFNSPIIWDGKIFLSGNDEENLAVFCFDAENGEILWEHKFNDIPGSPNPRPKVMDYTGYAAPTMATDGKGVYVIFGTGDIAGLDFDGNRLWAKNLGSPGNHYGHSSSLAVFGKVLIVQFDQNTGGKLLGLDVGTGEQVYNIVRDTEISWASPILINMDSRPEVVLSSNPFVISYDPVSGNELWRYDCMSGEVGPSPAYAEGIVFACNDYARLVAIKIGDVPELLWETDEDLSEISSPVANEEIVIMAASFGTVSCFDSKTGQKYWYYDADDGFYASPILVGGMIYIMDVGGVMHIIKADKEFELIKNNSLGEKSSTTPAFYNNRIYIRGEENLYCIGNN